MKNNKSFIAIFCFIISSSGMSLRSAEASQASQGYWSWLKETIYNIVVPSYIKAYRNIPHPNRLFVNLKIENGEQKDAAYLYDISRDSTMVRALRQELGIFGFYIVNASSSDIYKKYINNDFLEVFGRYREIGLTLDNDNSLEGCMSRLLIKMKENGPKTFGQSAEQDACVQLLWELEDTLWRFSTVKSKKFIKLAHKMYPDANNAMLADYLSIWKNYSFRFRRSLDLQKAINELRR